MVKQSLFKNGTYTFALTVNAQWLSSLIEKNGSIDTENVDVQYGNDGNISVKLNPIIRQAPKELKVAPLEERTALTYIQPPKPGKDPQERIEEIVIQHNVKPQLNKPYEVIQATRTSRGINAILKFWGEHYQQYVYYKLHLVDIGQVFQSPAGFTIQDMGNCKKGLVESIRRGICSQIKYNGEIWIGNKVVEEEGFE